MVVHSNVHLFSTGVLIKCVETKDFILILILIRFGQEKRRESDEIGKEEKYPVKTLLNILTDRTVP